MSSSMRLLGHRVPVRRRWQAADQSRSRRTITVSSIPRVSTTMCRLRPLTFFPPSKPCVEACTDAVAFTDCASMMPAVGSGSRPAASRTRSRSRSWNSPTRPWFRQRRKNA